MDNTWAGSSSSHLMSIVVSNIVPCSKRLESRSQERFGNVQMKLVQEKELLEHIFYDNPTCQNRDAYRLARQDV